MLPSGPPEQSQVQRVIQRMQKKDPYRIFAEVPSEEMVGPLPLRLRLSTISQGQYRLPTVSTNPAFSLAWL